MTFAPKFPYERTKYCFVYCGPEHCDCMPLLLQREMIEEQKEWKQADEQILEQAKQTVDDNAKDEPKH